MAASTKKQAKRLRRWRDRLGDIEGQLLSAVRSDWQVPLRASLFPYEDVSFLLPPSGEFS